MKRLVLTSALCLSLTACETVGVDEWPSLTTLNPFGEKQEVTKVDVEQPTLAPNASSVVTELNEMEKLTGMRLEAPDFEPTETQAVLDTPDVEQAETFTEEVAEVIDDIQDDIEPVFNAPIIETEITETPDLDAEDKLVEAVSTDEISIEKPNMEPIQVATKTIEMPKAVEPETAQLSSATGCPKIEIMPATRSITKFQDDMAGEMIARASISEIRGGCEVVGNGMEVDLDILMRGTIANAGRFEGKVNEEAFITFPYFISIFTPQGAPVNKDIMATAIRFRPSVDFADHAEKITQFIPMDNVGQSANYKIVVGYQLNRKQLEYNRIAITNRPNDKRASPDTSRAQRKSFNPLAE